MKSMSRITSYADPNANRSNESLINDLAASDLAVVHQARKSLVQRGNPAVPDLIKALQRSNGQTQWEVARALEEMRDPASALSLIGALTDENFVVRWVASQALANLREDGLRPLLHALIEQPSSVWLRRGAHRVLHILAKGKLATVTRPVLQALEDVTPTLDVPIAATKALDALKKRQRSQRK
jgi:HEAT repeat protein